MFDDGCKMQLQQDTTERMALGSLVNMINIGRISTCYTYCNISLIRIKKVKNLQQLLTSLVIYFLFNIFFAFCCQSIRVLQNKLMTKSSRMYILLLIKSISFCIRRNKKKLDSEKSRFHSNRLHRLLLTFFPEVIKKITAHQLFLRQQFQRHYFSCKYKFSYSLI